MTNIFTIFNVVFLFMILIALINVFTTIYKFFKNKKDEEINDLEYNEEISINNFKKFNIEEDISSLFYLITIIAKEYFEDKIMNYYEDKNGQESMRIPTSNKEHKQHIINISSVVLEVMSDEHLIYLTKYINLNKIKYIAKIYTKNIYESLLEEAIRIRSNAEYDKFENMKNNESDLPDYIKNILNKYNISLDNAKKEVKNYNINEKKIKSLANNNPEKQFGMDILTLRNYFNKGGKIN